MRIAFADESGIDGNTRCYAIGILSFDVNRLEHFQKVFLEIQRRHKVSGELKWSKVNNGHGLINLALEWFGVILRSKTVTFDLVAVNTRLYRLWSERGANREKAFYKTYTLLLRHIGRRTKVPMEVMIDDRSDAYPKQNEVMETIGNRMLAQLANSGRLQRVQKASSSITPGIQVADLLTGAFAASHRRRLEPQASLNPGKGLAIARLASMIGWDDLCYDAFPHPKLNIWHFPREYRADPETRNVVFTRRVPYIAPYELEVVRAARKGGRESRND